MSKHLERAATRNSTVEDLLDDILSAMHALVSRQRTSPASPSENFLLGSAIAHITANLAALTDAMHAVPTLSPTLPARLEALRAELRKANTAASAYQFAASHYTPDNCSTDGGAGNLGIPTQPFFRQLSWG